MSELSALDLARKIRAHELSVEEVALEALERAEANMCGASAPADASGRVAGLNAFITVCEREQVIERAREVQAQIDAGELADQPLAGVPIVVKDNICTKGVRTTCGSRMLESFVPAYDATAMERLREAGLILIGKTNMDEFGMGSTSETSAFGAVKNPCDPTRVAGGSSGGSAAAVAAGIVPLALGSDTGGSIRQPASHCGVVGLKPTYGTVSRYGLVAYASSMDQIGPIAGCAEDAEALYQVIAGYDERDATSVDASAAGAVHDDEKAGSSRSYTGIKGLRIGIPRGYFSSDRESTGEEVSNGVDANVAEAVLSVGRELEKQGAVLEEFDLDLIDYMVPAYYVIACAEASSNLERFDGVKYGHRAEAYEDLQAMYKKSRSEGFGEEVKRRILLGTFVLSQGYYDEYYLQACRVRSLITQSYKKAFEKYDVILSPVAPDVAPRLGETLSDPIRMYMSDLYTVPANLTGFPAVSVPVTSSTDKATDSMSATASTIGCDGGLPVGVQLMGDYFSESMLLEIAKHVSRTEEK
ncbi:MAG: Asp-tRNA(Asn)/Glu-tRNA(Gln) amidotransferase subunit GatA [Eubacterium sp.]|nr:Asp-tRNA(Asn)/Glu-tRNA(Gln) amidotransferase subunit GatA [Eubacterium sp.]